MSEYKLCEYKRYGTTGEWRPVEKDRVVVDLQAKVEELEQDLAKCREELATEKAKVEELESQLEARVEEKEFDFHQIERLVKDLAKCREENADLGIQNGNLVEKFNRLLYITGQLTMLRDKEGDDYKSLHAEYIGMKFPEFKAKAEGQEVEGC